MESLAQQPLTPASEANIVMKANRPKSVPYRMGWPREGFLSQRELNRIRHDRDVYNSIRSRETK
jgi:hypothetical protein